MKRYELTDEQRAQLKPWAESWIKNAISTKAMDDEEKEICRKAVKGLYQAANLEPPPDHRIVFVSSPFILRFASGFAAWIWYLRKNKKIKIVDAATDAATRDATRDATVDSNNKCYCFPIEQIKKLSDFIGVGIYGLKCAEKAYSMWNGGNQWSGWVSYLTFFRYIAQLKIDYSKFDCYEKLAIYSGPRIVHEKFCMISDRPKTLRVNAQNQPHCSDGPFCEWRDGSKLYSLNGVRVPGFICETPADKLDCKLVLTEKNAEVRREIVRKIGVDRTYKELGGKVLDRYEDYELITLNIGDGRIRPYLKMVNPSIKTIHIEGVAPECKTVKEALAWRNQDKVYIKPEKLT